MTSNSSNDSRQQAATPAGSTITSLLIFVHLFFVIVALSSNYVRSGLTSRLLSQFAFYSRFFNFDLNYTPYHLTHGTDADVDHRIEVLPKDSDRWLRIPENGFPGHDGYQRYLRYGASWSFQALNDGQPALFAQAVATHVSRNLGLTPQQVRCRKHFQQSREDLDAETPTQRNPEDPSRFSVPYAANAVVSANGSFEVVRIEEAGQVAAPVNSSGGARGTNSNERNR